MLDSDKSQDQIFNIENCQQYAKISVPMQPHDELMHRTTEFTIIMPGIEPIIEINSTEEGRVEGPDVLFLGSIASREALKFDPDSLVRGKIIGGYIMIIADPETRKLTSIVGTVDRKKSVQLINGRTRRG
jgi:hypothetical protein